jgi:hypothetical protein
VVGLVIILVVAAVMVLFVDIEENWTKKKPSGVPWLCCLVLSN